MIISKIPKLPTKKQTLTSVAVIATALGVSHLVDKATHSLIAQKAKDEETEKKLEILPHFLRSFCSILFAIFVSRGLSSAHPLKLPSWKESLNVLKPTSFLLAASVSVFNILVEYISSLAIKARPDLEKFISVTTMSCKILGSFGLVKSIGGMNVDASLGAVAGSCPCCGSPFFICLMDLVAIIQGFTKPINEKFLALFNKSNS